MQQFVQKQKFRSIQYATSPSIPGLGSTECISQCVCFVRLAGILCQPQGVEYAAHTIWRVRHAPERHSMIVLHFESKWMVYRNRDIAFMILLNCNKKWLATDQKIISGVLPWALAMLLMDSTTLSSHRVSSESLTFPCICNVPPSTLHIARVGSEMFIIHHIAV
jgi:hypothetical protein